MGEREGGERKGCVAMLVERHGEVRLEESDSVILALLSYTFVCSIPCGQGGYTMIPMSCDYNGCGQGH